MGAKPTKQPSPCFRHLDTAESRHFNKLGGWKLHLAVKPENYAAVDAWLDANHTGQYKLLCGGEPGESDFTIYIGARDDTDDFSARIEQEIGHLLETPTNWVDVIDVTNRVDVQFGSGKVRGRCDPRNDPSGASFEYYGSCGMPYDFEAKRAARAKAGLIEEHRKRIHRELVRIFGNRYLGTRGLYKPPWS